MLKFEDTEITNCFVITSNLFEDDRGYFHVPFHKDLFAHQKGYFTSFTQENESYSKYGTIRGLHFQKKEHAQSKMVRCPYGKILDVVVDLRPKSLSYKKVLMFELFKPNITIFIPKGCAHGFSVLSEEAILQYKVDRPYNKESEGGVRFDDPTFNIDWKIPQKDIIISEKDLSLPYFS
jgi:dTDP-4-dehydrorhamnose 3,5-epimerase